MATTAMDYEPANGDRFDGKSPPKQFFYDINPTPSANAQAQPQDESTPQPAADSDSHYLPNMKLTTQTSDEGSRFDDRRSASPRRADEGRDNERRRSASPGGAADRAPRDDHGSKGGDRDEDGAVNPGSNLFVTGIAPRLTESEVSRMFEKYGEVEKCQIMRDPHTKESRGFGFVKMVTSDQADAARDGLQGEAIEGRTLSIEKARRARPRTPTPGKYFGPPKREGGGRGGRFDRFDDRRRGGYGGGGGYGRDDPYRYRSSYDRRDDRGYDRGYDRGDRGGYREDRGYDRRDRDDGPRIDRYASGGRDERGGGGGGRGYDRGGDRGYDRGDRPPRDAGAGYDSGARGGGESRDYAGGERPMR